MKYWKCCGHGEIRSLQDQCRLRMVLTSFRSIYSAFSNLPRNVLKHITRDHDIGGNLKFLVWSRGDSNSQPLRDTLLRRARIPIPPRDRFYFNRYRANDTVILGKSEGRPCKNALWLPWPCDHFPVAPFMILARSIALSFFLLSLAWMKRSPTTMTTIVAVISQERRQS